MTKRKVIRRYNRPVNHYDWGGDFLEGMGFEKGKTFKDAFNFGDTFSGKNVGTMAKGLGGGLATGIGKIGGNLIGGGLESGAGSAISNIGGTIGSAISTVNPLIGGIVSIGSGLVGGLTNRMFGSKMNKENIASVEGGIAQANSFTSDASSFDGLMTNWGAAPTIAGFNNSYIGKDGWFSNKAKKKARELRAKAEKANKFVEASLDNNADNIKDTMADNLEAHYVAYGGPLFGGAIGYELANKRLYNQQLNALGKNKLTSMPNSFPAIDTFAFGGNMGNGTDWSNGLIFINEGGTHEANPYEGVPMGVDMNGTPNLVEEGEVIWNDYVFSNRLNVPKAIRQKYKLRKNEELSFADAAKELQKESEERPNDPISQNGLRVFMNELASLQEKKRMENQSNLFAFGGTKGNLFDGTGDKPNIINTWKYGTAQSEGFKYLSNGEYDPSYRKFIEETLTQEMLDDFFTKNPNLFSRFTASNPNYKPQLAQARKWALDGKISDFHRLAGMMYEENTPKEPSYTPYTKRWIREKGADGVWRTQQISDEDWAATPSGRTYLMRNPQVKEGNTVTSDKGDKDIYYDIIPEDIPQSTPVSSSRVEDMKTNPLRYAPIFGAGISVLNDLFGGNEPNYSNANMFAESIKGSYSPVRFTPIGNYLAYNPLDREFYLNSLRSSQGATRRAIANNSGGNRANAIAGILAADYNAGNQFGTFARQAEEYNANLRQKVEDFNRATNMFNSEGFMKADTANATQRSQQGKLYGTLAGMRQDIYDRNRAEKSANLTNLLQGLGDLGMELTDKDKIRWLADKDVLRYANGGKKKTRKRGFTI